MSDMTYFRIGVPNDMVADIMWNDDFEVSIESYSKHETNYQRYFGTPERVAEWLCFNIKECPDCEYFETDKCSRGYLEWLESEAE